MDTEKKRRLIDELDDETKQALMRLYPQWLEIREFMKIVKADLEEGVISIPIRCEPKAPDDDDDHLHDE